MLDRIVKESVKLRLNHFYAMKAAYLKGNSPDLSHVRVIPFEFSGIARARNVIHSIRTMLYSDSLETGTSVRRWTLD